MGSLDAANLNSLNLLLENASIILWVSGGNLYKAERPDFAPVLGLARSVMLELPSVKFLVLDVNTTEQELVSAQKNIATLLQRATRDPGMDLEYLQHQGILHISRFVPDLSLSRRFEEKQNQEAMDVKLRDAGVCQLSIKHVGQMDTIHFASSPEQNSPLKSNFLEIQASVLGLNAKVSNDVDLTTLLCLQSIGCACIVRAY